MSNKCETCGKEFANAFGVKIHRARTHDLVKNKEVKEQISVIAEPEVARAKVAKEKKAPVLVKFCPCCGLNMAAVTVAVNYAR